MILISHRGNINGPNPLEENKPSYIDGALLKGFQVEIDIWKINSKLFLGHDEPQYEINTTWLEDRKNFLWIHTKNIFSLLELQKTNYNYFWHENDTVTLTSKKYIWAYPGKQKIENSIAVMPEIHNDDINDCIGICSDYIYNYGKNFCNNTCIPPR
jgi:hypothetical protein